MKPPQKPVPSRASQWPVGAGRDDEAEQERADHVDQQACPRGNRCRRARWPTAKRSGAPTAAPSATSSGVTRRRPRPRTRRRRPSGTAGSASATATQAGRQGAEQVEQRGEPAARRRAAPGSARSTSRAWCSRRARPGPSAAASAGWRRTAAEGRQQRPAASEPVTLIANVVHGKPVAVGHRVAQRPAQRAAERAADGHRDAAAAGADAQGHETLWCRARWSRASSHDSGGSPLRLPDELAEEPGLEPRAAPACGPATAAAPRGRTRRRARAARRSAR